MQFIKKKINRYIYPWMPITGIILSLTEESAGVKKLFLLGLILSVTPSCGADSLLFLY